ncbi:hypothetical protein KAR91_21475 [Candidatus Pacearchaeota archaeon]|nr:hypothetical protein [Candidatus Pacearchaeota archaeon]
MRAKDIEIGESYRHKDHPTYAWARPLKILKPKEAENPHNRIVVKCEWTTRRNANFGMIKYFKPSDLMKA